MNEQDKKFFKNYSIVIGLLALMIIIFLVAARILGLAEMERVMASRQTKEISKQTEPVGQVRMAGEAQPQQQAAPAAPQQTAAADTGAGSGDVGKKVFNGLCVSCHGTGLPGAPQFGNKEEWAPRIAQGKDTLYQHALHGFSSGAGGVPMPPKGGNPALSDDEVKAAVDYMVANSK
jgi:cytochrome c5